MLQLLQPASPLENTACVNPGDKIFWFLNVEVGGYMNGCIEFRNIDVFCQYFLLNMSELVLAVPV